MGTLPGPLPFELDDRSPEEQAEYRLHVKLANRHRWYQGIYSSNARQMATPRLPLMQNQLKMLSTFVLRAWSDGALNLQLECYNDIRKMNLSVTKILIP